MDFYSWSPEEMHRDTADLHAEKGGVVVDAAHMPTPSGRYVYEVMAMRKRDGREIECRRVDTLDEAREAYREMYGKYIEGRKT